MTDQDYEQKKRECWENFCDEHLFDPHNIITQGIFRLAFDRAYVLGKQETKQETKQEIVIRGWVTFDDCIYECFLHTTKPVRKNVQIDDGVYQMEWRSEGLMYILDGKLFPDMDSDSEPQEVEIIIKRKNMTKEPQDLFGENNLTSDAEGEDEVLTCEKWKIEETLDYCDELDSISGNHNMRNWGEQMIAHLFGPKCQPDDTKNDTKEYTKEPAPASPPQSNHSGKLNSSKELTITITCKLQ